MSLRRPGWQPGVSCPNGAGNHRYTEEEKHFLANDPAILEAKRMIQRDKEASKMARKLRRKKVTLLAKEHPDITDAALAVLTDVSQWDTHEVTLTCVDGHKYQRTGAQLARVRKGATICPTCANSKRGKPRANARLRFYMRADEQGFDVLPFKSLAGQVSLLHRTTGLGIDLFSYQLKNWRGAGNDRTIRFVADEDDHVFLWMGHKPKVKHPFIKKMLAVYPAEEYSDYGGLEGLKKAIKECLSEGDKVINLSLNDTWTDSATFNTYEWGHLPMTNNMRIYHEEYSKKLP